MLVELGSFDAIIGMDWLAKYQAVIVCTEKIVRIPCGNGNLINTGRWKLKLGKCDTLNIHFVHLKTQKYMHKGFPIFLAHVTAKEVEDKSERKRLEDVPIVRDFPEPQDTLSIGALSVIDKELSAATERLSRQRLYKGRLPVSLNTLGSFGFLFVKMRRRIYSGSARVTCLLEGLGPKVQVNPKLEERFEKEDIPKTGIQKLVTGHYEFQVMPFGLDKRTCRAPILALRGSERFSSHTATLTASKKGLGAVVDGKEAGNVVFLFASRQFKKFNEEGYYHSTHDFGTWSSSVRSQNLEALSVRNEVYSVH
ncbi:hypothetical protein Tco_0326802 [Tanacetum coccineum]